MGHSGATASMWVSTSPAKHMPLFESGAEYFKVNPSQKGPLFPEKRRPFQEDQKDMDAIIFDVDGTL